MDRTSLRKRNLGIATLVISSIMVVWFLTKQSAELDFRFDDNPIEQAVSFAMRENSEEPLALEFNTEQVNELVSRLETLEPLKKDNRFTGLTPLYQISATSAGGAPILLNGYSLTEDQIEIEYQDNRYVVADEDFRTYFETVCARLMAQTEYVELYEDFYQTTLKPVALGIQKLALFDLDFNTIPELVVFTPGASGSAGCVIFTIEQGVVRSFNTTDAISAYAEIDHTEPLVPLSQNVIAPSFWANYLAPESLEFTESRFLLCKERLGDQQSWILCSANGYDSGSWGTWYRFGSKEGALMVEPLLSYEFVGQWSHKSVGKDQWYINGEEVTETEYDKARAEFLASLDQQYELVAYDLAEFVPAD